MTRNRDMSPHKYWLTQSILGDWLYCADADDRSELIRRLMRERKETTTAMQRGIEFENLVTDWANGGIESASARMDNATLKAVRKFGNLCKGGVDQVPLAGDLSIEGMDFTLFGIADFVKAGRIFDIKRVSRYEYGKYQHSPQHPMYLHLLPEASRFDYLIFDGKQWYTETYRREDCVPIETTIRQFVRYLRDTNTIDIYRDIWRMNEERIETTNGIYRKI